MIPVPQCSNDVHHCQPSQPRIFGGGGGALLPLFGFGFGGEGGLFRIGGSEQHAAWHASALFMSGRGVKAFAAQRTPSSRLGKDVAQPHWPRDLTPRPVATAAPPPSAGGEVPC